jgi:branched-subunit amino acid aminotransferase/4-amino-4-deoxychorismate lyase
MTRAIRALVVGLSVETLPIDDRGLQYGHGMFETCRVVDGRVPSGNSHRARLSATAARLGIPLDLALVEADASQIAAGLARGIEDTVTAGEGGRGYRSNEVLRTTSRHRISCIDRDVDVEELAMPTSVSLPMPDRREASGANPRRDRTPATR